MKYFYFINYLKERCLSKEIHFIEPLIIKEEDKKAFVRWEIDDRHLLVVFNNGDVFFYQVEQGIPVRFGKIDSIFGMLPIYNWVVGSMDVF